MALLDVIFLVGLLISVVLGLLRGFIYELLALLNWVLAFVLAQWLGPGVGAWLMDLLSLDAQSEALARGLGYTLVFIVSAFAGGVVVWGIPKLVEQAGLRPVDRMLGAAFGVLRACVVALAVTVLVLMTSYKNQGWWLDSYAAGASVYALKHLKPLLPGGAASYINN